MNFDLSCSFLRERTNFLTILIQVNHLLLIISFVKLEIIEFNFKNLNFHVQLRNHSFLLLYYPLHVHFFMPYPLQKRLLIELFLLKIVILPSQLIQGL